jgi:signal transduction histidine kinase
MGPVSGASDAVDADALQALVQVSADGLGVLGPDGRFRSVNAAGAAALGLPADQLLGRPGPFPIPADGAERPQEDSPFAVWLSPDGRRRTLRHRLVPMTGGAHAVWFSDVTDALRQQERLTAIARAASSVADAWSLRATLDAVAREVVMTAHIAAVQILAMDDPREEVQILGMAGFGDAADFTERLSACRRLGAPMRFTAAFQTGRTVVDVRRRDAVLADPRWAPLHRIMGSADWDSFAAVPLVVRGRTVGVMNAYYLHGEDPGPGSLVFLEAMADHAAVAIDTAALLTQTRAQAESEERRRLARDLHDSVVQQLFSMRMQAGALTAQLDSGEARPARVRAAAQELAELAQSALADLRGLVFELRPLELEDHGLIEAVRSSAASLQARTGIAVVVRAPEGADLTGRLGVQEDVYRIVQEALHNVVKHARATTVEVRFRETGTAAGLVVEVLDDGSGPVPAVGDGRPTLGLVSMRERAERWGGQLTAGPRAGGGWAVRLGLPPASARLEGPADDTDGTRDGR